VGISYESDLRTGGERERKRERDKVSEYAVRLFDFDTEC
jgi:hypothetical protein